MPPTYTGDGSTIFEGLTVCRVKTIPFLVISDPRSRRGFAIHVVLVHW